jgi:hypothetical protein
MKRSTRRWLVVAAIVCGGLAAVAFLVSIGRGIAAPVSNCNRDCDDGTHAMYAAIVLGGVAVVSIVTAALAGPPPPAPPPQIPEARARSKS